MYLIVGLGNPGSKYEKTRHNVGFVTVDVLAGRLGIKVNKLKFKSLIGEGNIGSEKVVLIKPQTYMNLSGEAVMQAINFYKPDHDKIFVIYDDIDLDVGRLRIRKKGSGGTHNGMKNIIYLTGFDDFPRFRIGVSKPKNGQDLASFVTSGFNKDEIKPLCEAIDNTADAIVLAIKEDIDKAMNKYNV